MSLIEAGVAKQQVGDLLGAEACFSAALAEDPSNHQPWQNLAVIEAQKGNLESAVAMTERAIQLDRSSSAGLTHCNLGNLLWRAEKFDEAKEAFDKAQSLGLDSWSLWSNLGLLYLSLGEPLKAIEHFRKSFETLSDEQQIKKQITDLGYAYLMSGDLQKGFGLVREEWNKPVSPICDLGIPQWIPSLRDNVQLQGAKVLVYHNQGAGDTIQFSRFLPLISQMGAEIHLAVPSHLVDLLQYTCLAYRVYDIAGPPPQGMDLIVSISQLPHIFKIDMDYLVSHSGPYIFYSNFEKSHRPRVGLVWAARQDQETGKRRSIPLEQLLPLSKLPINIYSLQVGKNASDVEKIGAQHLIKDLSPQIHNFLDLTKVMSQMDVIVSADTAPLHLAGAMGVPSIGMISYSAADWRWLGKDYTTSPWYPGMQLVRQETAKRWEVVVEEVAGRLKGMLHG